MILKYRFKMGLSPIEDGRYTMQLPSATDFNSDFLAEDFGTSTQTAYPLFGNDLSISYEAEADTYNFRKKLSGGLKFVGPDFAKVKSMTLEDVMIVHIEVSYDGGEEWELYYRGSFTKTDCEFDFDNKIATATITTTDGYDEVLSGLSKELDLVRLAPKVSRVNFSKRPMLQYYVLGADFATNILGNEAWEVAFKTTISEQYLLGHQFAKTDMLRNVQVDGDSDVRGTYTGIVSDIGTATAPIISGTLYKQGGEDYINYRWSFNNGFWFPDIQLVHEGEVLYSFQSSVTAYSGELTYFKFDDASVYALMNKRDFYARILTDVEVADGVPTAKLSGDDPAGSISYKRALPFNPQSSTIYISRRLSPMPTEWGLADDEQYYLPPIAATGKAYYPVARGTWQKTSFWFGYPDNWTEVEEVTSKEYALRDAYSVADAIAAILAEVAPDVTHKATADYSEFLYGNAIVRKDAWQLFISPKSNIVRGEYQVPAKRATITLQSLLDGLRDIYQLYWFIDGGKLRIEHIQWFRNGGSYIPDDSLIVDLTDSINCRTGKVWAFGQNKARYDKEAMPERYEFAWMESASRAFVGEPIKILSPAVELDNIQSVQIASFNADIDYMLANPSEVSEEGFVIMAGNPVTLATSVQITGVDSRIVIEPRGYERQAKMTISTTGTTSQYEVIFYASGNIIGRYGYFNPATASELNFTIPASADAIGFAGIVAAIAPRLTVDSLGIPNEVSLPMVSVGDFEWPVQNGYLALSDVLPKYWVYNLPYFKVEINGKFSGLVNRKKTLKQDVTFPSLVDIDPLRLIRTGLGNGQVESASVNLTSRTVTVTLMYE